MYICNKESSLDSRPLSIEKDGLSAHASIAPISIIMVNDVIAQIIHVAVLTLWTRLATSFVVMASQVLYCGLW